jgi:formate dehydrogenase
MLHVIFAEELADDAAVAAHTTGIEKLRAAAARCTPELAAARCGVDAAEIRDLARAFATASSATAYGRTGACLGRHATLVNVLLDALNVVTGNLDRPGGSVFARPPIDFTALAVRLGLATFDSFRTRVGGLPEVLGQLPAPLMAAEIETPGRGQIKALIVSAGNPVLSVPGAHDLERALGTLELQVGIDLYLNETHKHADYVLPATTFYERDDLPLPLSETLLTPYLQWTDAVVPPRGEARDDWRIIDDLARQLGFAAVTGVAAKWIGTSRASRLALRAMGPIGHRATPAKVVDMLLRSGRDGDRFGLRRDGLNLAKLRAQPRGIVVADQVETGVAAKRIKHRDGRVHLDDARIDAELTRLLESPDASGEFPLLMIGRREVRSHNSWLHNTPKFQDGTRRHRALVNPADAGDAADGATVRIVSARGTIELPIELTDDVAPGTIAVPHGWGHRDGGWQTANAAGGANVNEITSPQPADLEQLSGMAHLNGVPVRLESIPVKHRPRHAAAVG